MVTVILAITLFNLGVETTTNTVAVVHTLKAVHHHFTRPIYHHTIGPVVKKVKGQ